MKIGESTGERHEEEGEQGEHEKRRSKADDGRHREHRRHDDSLEICTAESVQHCGMCRERNNGPFKPGFIKTRT